MYASNQGKVDHIKSIYDVIIYRFTKLASRSNREYVCESHLWCHRVVKGSSLVLV